MARPQSTERTPAVEFDPQQAAHEVLLSVVEDMLERGMVREARKFWREVEEMAAANRARREDRT